MVSKRHGVRLPFVGPKRGLYVPLQAAWHVVELTDLHGTHLKRYICPDATGWALFALGANLICEELWFRGYLQDKLAFLGRGSWVGAGLLFTL